MTPDDWNIYFRRLLRLDSLLARELDVKITRMILEIKELKEKDAK